MFDLEKYFKQQAALAEQKRKLKKVSKKSSDKDHSVPVKKAKVLSTGTKTNKKCQKSKHENSKDNTLQSTDKAGSNVANETSDNSSESEYIPSDNEVDSGKLIFDVFR